MHKAKGLDKAQTRTIHLALINGMDIKGMDNKDTIKEGVDLVKKKRTDSRECPILSESDVPSTTPTATSDSHAATTEQPVCPTSLTTNDAAGAHAKS